MKTILNIILTPFKMIWSIFDNDAHRIVSKKGLNLLQMENKLDSQLAQETPSSLIEWMESKRKQDEYVEKLAEKFIKDEVQVASPTINNAIKIGFAEGYKQAKADYDPSECVNCDELKETHQICMDCIGKLIKENQESLYTEEQVIEFTKWLASDWFALWVKDKFLWECDWSENAENQDYKGYYTEKQLLELFKSLKQK
jgi:ribosomal protein L32